MKQELKIEPIPDIKQDLLIKILREEVVVFIGSGVSMLAGVPSWTGLALEYLKDWRSSRKLPYDVYDKLKREKTDPLELLTICSGVLGVEVVKKQLKEKLTGRLTVKDMEYISRIYGYIRDLKTGYITTNYDDFLETTPPTTDELSIKENDCLKKLQKITSVNLNQVDLDDRLDIPMDKIVYLHGKALPSKEGVENKIILTLEDYLDHYKDIEKGKNGKSFLKQVFKNNTFLFIGLGLKEFEIIQHIQKPYNNAKHYLLMGVSNYEQCILEQYKNYYKILNIEPIFYDMSQNGFHQLEYVLKAWSDKVRVERIKNYENMIATKKDRDNLLKIQRHKDGSFR